MAAAVAASTSRVRIALAALITPLRNPVVLAKDLATLDRLSAGRLVVQPTVSWARDEYEAVGVAFESRGRILDDGLAAMKMLWREAPASYEGEYFSFDTVYSKPSPVDPGGPALWFGGQSVHPPLLRRLVAHGSGFHPFGSPSRADLEALEARSEGLSQLAQHFKAQATKAKRFQMWQHAKYGAVVGGAVTVGVAVLVLPVIF